MSIRKKVVWLPYDMDTAIGINNEGALAFSYNLEDTDQTSGGADVYNGQHSVLWTNLRDAFGSELTAMYKSLRSAGVLSYSTIEQMFEQHQGKWPEAIFNEDAFFKYLQPLIDDNDGAYLSMLQGSKAEQRKWWLYNRFRYLDSKYNAGDALTDVITLRGYAKDNITITPYADIYPCIKYGSYLVQTRGERGNSYTLVCPLDQVNDTEIYIYSASQLASVGDISGLKVGYANFANGTKLQDIKIGDADPTYSNGNLTELYLGNNTLLQTLDVRNCPNLLQTVDLKGCTTIEEVYFDGTSIAGVELPNGGVLNTLHLPGTITNLTIRNQPNLADLTVDDYSNVTTLWLEKLGNIDTLSILFNVEAQSRVRLIGMNWEVADSVELASVYEKLDTMRGLTEYGENVPKAQVSGTINVQYLIGDPATIGARYPDLDVTYDELETYTVTFMADDRTTVLQEVTDVIYGRTATYTGDTTPTRTGDSVGEWIFSGWSPLPENVVEDIVCYPQFIFTGSVLRQIIENKIGSDVLESNAAGEIAANLLRSAQANGIKTIRLPYARKIRDNFAQDNTQIESVYIESAISLGSNAFRSTSNLKTFVAPSVTTVDDTAFESTGLEKISLPACETLYTGVFRSCTKLKHVNLPAVTIIYGSAFLNCTALESVNLPALTNLYRTGIFNGCSALKKIELPSLSAWDNAASDVFKNCTSLEYIDLAYCGSYIRAGAFGGCTGLKTLIIRRSSVLPINNLNAFTGTKYATSGAGGAYVYVPRDLISTYQNATNWATLYAAHSDMFRPLEDYTLDGTVDGSINEALL